VLGVDPQFTSKNIPKPSHTRDGCRLIYVAALTTRNKCHASGMPFNSR
jgi:hypothetical protein